MDDKKFLDKVVDRLLKESMYRLWEDKNITNISKYSLKKILVDIKFALINTRTQKSIEYFNMKMVHDNLTKQPRKSEHLEDYEEDHLTNIYGLNSDEIMEVIHKYYNLLYNNIYSSYLEMNEDDKVPTSKPEEWFRGDEVFEIGGSLNESLSSRVNKDVDDLFSTNKNLTDEKKIKSIFMDKYGMNKQDADQAMVIYLSKQQSLNESTEKPKGMDLKYLFKVADSIMKEIKADDSTYIYTVSAGKGKSRAYSPWSKMSTGGRGFWVGLEKHAKDTYGLTDAETKMVSELIWDSLNAKNIYLGEKHYGSLREQHYEDWDERSREQNINLLKAKGIDILSTDINVPFYKRIDSKEIRFLKNIADRLDKESKIEVVGEAIDDDDFILLTPFGKFQYFDFINEYRHRRFENFVKDMYGVGDNQLIFPTHNSISQIGENYFLYEMYKDKLKRKWHKLVNPGLDIPDEAIIIEQDLSDEELKSLDSSFEYMGTPPEIASEELGELITWVKDLPEELFLYRVLYLDDTNQINYDELGSHYSQDRTDLINNHYDRGSIYGHAQGEDVYLITVKVPKSEVDVMETLNNNILYPHEQEITLKNKGRGATYLDIEKI